MISLARHIEILLLEHDCVIIPGFGGFLTNYEEAVVPYEHTAQLMPPLRHLYFNQALQSNDGLLVQSYMQAYDAAYPEANKQMQMDIADMDSQLKIRGSYVLDHIGRFSIDLHHHISFEPASLTLLTPQFYALPILPMLSVEQAEKERELQQALAQTTVLPIVKAEQDSKHQKTTNQADGEASAPLHRRWIDIAISAAAAVVVFFAFSYSALHQPTQNEPVVVSAASIQAPTVQTGGKASTNAKPKTDDATAAAAQEQEAEPTTTDADSDNATITPAEQTSAYAIVLASGVQQKLADDYIQKMKKNGFGEARFYKDTTMNRVVYGTYADYDTAHSALVELRKQSDEFTRAWVMEIH